MVGGSSYAAIAAATFAEGSPAKGNARNADRLL